MNARENIELRAVVDLINKNHEDTTKEIADLKKLHDERHEELLQFCRSGFPNGDLHEHRNFHAQIIENEKDRKELKREILKKIVTGGVWGAVVFLFSMAITWFKEHILK